ncbi:MAG: hypothetical protein ABIQ61_03125 [Ornithinibacter sp.]
MIASLPRNITTARCWCGAMGGRPRAFDEQHYKNRAIVEPSFTTIEQWRALGTQQDKLAMAYRAGVVRCAIPMWLDASADTP